ncbi:MAG: hypothetical protein PSV13_13310 [Lacunisphaera sp.]|nr:hypothetical protein [Lacunisphaera sp.]
MTIRLILLLAALSAGGYFPVLVVAEEGLVEPFYWRDLLTDDVEPAIASARTNVGGRFEPAGWRVVGPQAFLRITLPRGLGAEGKLEVNVKGLDPGRLMAAIGRDKKVHFINLFSNVTGDHHVEDGGGETDALWTLRIGTDAAGASRYGQGFKLLWASRGAKRARGSDYAETEVTLPAGSQWDAAKTYTFAIHWSRSIRRLTVSLDQRIVAQVPWRDDEAPLRHAFLGGTPDFHALMGALFSDLRISSSPDTGMPPAVSE